MLKKHNILSWLLAFSLCFAIAMPALAVDTAGKYVPTTMQPSTVLFYDADGQMFVINQGSEVVKHKVTKNSNPANEPISDIEVENELIAKIRAEAANLPVFFESRKDVVTPNTVVVYGTDGYINHIYDCNDEVLQTYASEKFNSIEQLNKIGANTNNGAVMYSSNKSYNPLPRGTRREAGVYKLAGGIITITSGSVLGEGRLSTFDDKIGENGSGDPNKAGDCATKGEYDNPQYHQVIHVRNLDNDIDKYLRKNDNGDLPYAVLDIFKWDGVMMGETYSETFTFENGRYYYNF